MGVDAWPAGQVRQGMVCPGPPKLHACYHGRCAPQHHSELCECDAGFTGAARRGRFCHSALSFAVIHRDSLYKKKRGDA
jgi:hypothetical protein